MRKGFFVCFLLISVATAVYGQTDDFHHQKDSLLKVIASTKGEEKLKTYRELVALQFPEEEFDLILQGKGRQLQTVCRQRNRCGICLFPLKR